MASPEAPAAAAAEDGSAELRGLYQQFGEFLQPGSAAAAFLTQFMSFVTAKHDAAVHGQPEEQVAPIQIVPSTKPPLAADVSALKEFISKQITSASNLARAYVNHQTAGNRFSQMVISQDPTVSLPSDLPKTLLPPKNSYTVSDALPADFNSTNDAAAELARRVYIKIIVDELGKAKTSVATQLATLLDSHEEAFDTGLEKFFTAGVPAAEKTRLTLSAKLDYSTAVEAAKAKYQIAALYRVLKVEENAKNFEEQKFAAL